MKKDRLYTVDKGLASVVQKQTQPKNVFAFGGQDNARWDRLASRAYGAQYGDDGYTLSDYMNHKNGFGISRQNNPFSKGNIGGTLRTASGIIGAIPTGERRGMFDTLDPLHHLAGGRETGLGNAVGDAGVGLFQAGAQSGNGALMIAGAIAKGAGSLINAGWGTKKNKGNINAITQNTAQAREAGNMLTGASTTSDLINAAGNMTGSMGFGTTDLVKGGWFSKGKARRQGQKFLNKENAALAYQNQGMMLGANNVDSTLDNMVMGNFAAYGGPFEMASRMPYTEQNNSNDMGAIEYGFMSDYLIAKNRQNDTKNKIGGISPMPMMNGFAEGGKIEIKHPGRLTALKKRTGKTEAELWAEGKPEVRKMITFARNARKWKKAYGGFLDATNNLFPYGGGIFSGSGSGGSWDGSTDTYPEVKDFNEAFDNAVKAGLKEFIFQGRRYNTQKEHNPVREYNNRWVGQGRRSDVKNPSKAYDHQAGPIGGPLSLIPIVTDTYIGSSDRPYRLEYNPNATEQLTSPFRSYAWERPKTIRPKNNLHALGGDKDDDEDLENLIFYLSQKEKYPNGRKKTDAEKFLNYRLGVPERKTAPWFEEMPAYIPESPSEHLDRVIGTASKIVKGIGEQTKKKTSQGEPYIPHVKFAFGGNMGTNSADFSTGLTHIDAGQSHELNPNEGVQVGVDNEGTPNLVEEGEVIFNDYVFSNRIGIDDDTKDKFHIGKKREMTYAELAKKLEKEIAERPNDPISKASFKAQMEQLAEQQERQKKEMEAERARQAFEALSDEEKVAVMQQAAQQEQAAQEAALQEQAAMEQQPVEQPSPEDMAMMQQQMQQAPVVQEQTQPVEASVQMAMGGKLYPWGGTTGLFNVTPPYAASRTAGFIPYTRDLTEEEVLKREQDPIFQEWTKYVNDNWDAEDVQAYLRALDQAAGGNHLFDSEGNILPAARDYYNHARTGNHKWGYYHLTPEKIAEKAAEEAKAAATGKVWHTVVGDGDMLPDDPNSWVGVGEEVRRQVMDNGDTVIYHSAAPDATQQQDTGSAKQIPAQPEGEGDIVPVHRNEKLRYVGLLGPAVGLGMQALGIGRPDTRGLDASLDLLNNGVALADYKPIGNYLRYRPMDIWAEQNRLNANARATDRAIQNSGSNQGAKIAGLLSNEYNNQIGSGELYRKALEYNDALRERQATFNRGTDQFNAEAYNRTALQNAEMLNRNRQMRAQLGLDVASQKMAADAAWNQGIYGNVAGLFKGIGDVGRENYQHNRIADMAATGIFGTIDPDTSFIANGYLTRRKKNSRGGKLNKGGRK